MTPGSLFRPLSCSTACWKSIPPRRQETLFLLLPPFPIPLQPLLSSLLTFRVVCLQTGQSNLGSIETGSLIASVSSSLWGGGKGVSAHFFKKPKNAAPTATLALLQVVHGTQPKEIWVRPIGLVPGGRGSTLAPEQTICILWLKERGFSFIFFYCIFDLTTRHDCTIHYNKQCN